MIYCPGCKKPSAKNSGICPHCGVSLDGKGSVSPAAGKPPSASGPKVAAELRYGGADIETDIGQDLDNSPLELASDDFFSTPTSVKSAAGRGPQGGKGSSSQGDLPRFAPSSAGSSQRALSITEADQQSKIEGIAQFGPCEDGILGIMKYGLRVYQRLPILRAETNGAKDRREAAWQALEVAKAKLGRYAHRSGLKDGNLGKLCQRAVNADGRLESVQREEDGLNQQFQKKFATIDAVISKVEEEMEPVSQKEQETRIAFEQITKERARVTAKIKRTEIELRNIQEIITKKQTAYADLQRPKEERSQLLKEIADADHRQLPLHSRLQREQQELEATRAPSDAIGTQLQHVQTSLRSYQERISRLKSDRMIIEKEHQAGLDALHGKAKGESKQAQEAWAAVGQLVYVEKLLDEERLVEVEDAAATFFAAQESLTLHEQAVESYRKDTYEQAKKYWMIAAGIGGGLLILLVAAIVF